MTATVDAFSISFLNTVILDFTVELTSPKQLNFHILPHMVFPQLLLDLPVAFFLLSDFPVAFFLLVFAVLSQPQKIYFST